MKSYVIYRRVSTRKQGARGHGLDAQDRDIELFLQSYAGEPWEILGTFTDIQSGKDDDRPELGAALAVVRKNPGCELLVSKLDRLSRKVSFIAALMEDKRVGLRVASMPHADKFQMHIYSALAEQERDFISQRTKAALREARRNGKTLGGHREGALEARNAVLVAEADAAARKVAGVIVPLREAGNTLQSIADTLNGMDYPTPRGAAWTTTGVRRALARLERRVAP